MKPISITIENFGPFSGPAITVAFSQLDALFLISGDTGAGKTTIFDAMSYALYGSLLGTRREDAARSHFAEDAWSTSVEFEFETSSGRWKVLRSPWWVEKHAKSEKLKKPAPHLLVQRMMPGETDWQVVCGKASLLDDAIIEAVGFSHEHFSKIIVLPQGEFQRFLEMASAEREGLLEKLFPVSEHKALALAASERASGIEGESRILEARRAEVLKYFDPATSAEQKIRLEEDCAEATKAGAEARSTADANAKALSEAEVLFRDFEDLQNRSAEQSALDGDSAAMDVQRQRLDVARRALALMSSVDSAAQTAAVCAIRTVEYAAAERIVSEESALFDAACIAWESVEQKKADLKAGEQRIAALQGRRTILAELIARVGKKAAGEEAHIRASHDNETASARLRELAEAVVDVEDLREVHEKDAERLGVIKEEGRELGILKKDILKIRELEESGIPGFARNCAAAGAALVAAQAVVDAARLSLDDAEELRQRFAAAGLAAHLLAGEACPVCGSREHPEPAEYSGETPIWTDVIAQRKAVMEKAQNAAGLARTQQALSDKILADAQEEIGQLKEHIVAAGFADAAAVMARIDVLGQEFHPLEELCRERALRIAGLPDLKKQMEDARILQLSSRETLVRIETEGAELLRQISVLLADAGSPADPVAAYDALDEDIAGATAALRHDAEVLAAIEKAYFSAKENRAVAEKAGTLARQALAAATIDRDASAGACAEALSASGFADEAAVRAALVADAERTAAEAAIAEYDSACAACRARIDDLRQKTEGRIRPDLSALRLSHEVLVEKREQLGEVLNTAKNTLGQFVEKCRLWDLLEAEQKELDERGAMYRHLSYDLNGRGGQKRSFAGFVLGRWLSRVLAAGTRRFSLLSNGRYRFVFNDSADDGRKKAGLEIDVHDAHTGELRGVRTLSGGEKFLASLALALGLSDVIQAQSGGRRLEALFIDEGFGSLDGEVLDRAIAVLDEIGVGRQVGIISHVESLKKAIPCQVRVEKGPAGSRVSVTGIARR